jgi:hypothetical protein
VFRIYVNIHGLATTTPTILDRGRRFGARGRSEIPENLKNDDAKFNQQNEPPGAHWEHFFGHRGGDPNRGHTTDAKHEELTQIYRNLRKTRGIDTDL